MRRDWRVPCLFIVFIVAACTTHPPRGTGPLPSVPHQSATPGVAALLHTAEQARHAGRLDDAGAALERAQRLESRNALVWQRLAALRLQQRLWDDAVQTALKSNALAGADWSLQARNWDIIARARGESGDAAGARAARAKAMELGQKAGK